MNKRITLFATVIAAALVAVSPGWVSAQEPAAPSKVKVDVKADVKAETMGEAKAEAKDETMAEPPAEEMAEHTVVKGDTLWDISGKYLSDPFLWPEVWKANPGIVNPHLIYPGEMVRLPGIKAPETEAVAGAEQPGEEAGEPGAPMAAAAVKREKSPFDEEPFVDISKTILRIPEEKTKKVISLDETKKPKIPVATLGGILEAGFIAEDADDGIEIIGSPLGEREIFSFGDEVYILARDYLKPGDKLISYRLEDEVEHPATGDDLGELIKVTGLLVVLRQDGDYMVCKVEKTINDIRFTDLMMPYTVPELVFEPVPRNRRLKGEWGYIVAGQELKKLSAATYNVYLDLGSADHVKPGDSFVIKRSGGSIRAREEGHYYLVKTEYFLPDVEIGSLQVISVQDETCTAKVVSFTEPVKPGQRVYYKD